MVNLVEDLSGSLIQKNLCQPDPNGFSFVDRSLQMVPDEPLPIGHSNEAIDLEGRVHGPTESSDGHLAPPFQFLEKSSLRGDRYGRL